MAQTRRIQQLRRLALESNGVFCSEEEDVVPSDIILGGRGAVGAGITVLGFRRVWHDTRAVPASGSGLRAFKQWQPSETGTRHGGAKRGLRKVKSL